ncbi:hypothetical protein K388_05851 [Streptomyces sp. KhCrAH-43]|uniref:hypothetical protein n=1 Tax=unclassified Streptomyces TaxID=2593676 RepID=UPI000DC564D0|nr:MULTISPECIES: hypothetical protein [unclassified Streptomyces]RAJ52752.1 hypothetical protein K388_05851 [Streptomyces sp. KhCrAH-43]
MLYDDRGAFAQRLIREITLGLLDSAISASSLAVATTSGTAAYRRVSAHHGHYVRLAAGLAAAFTGGVITDGLLDVVTARARRRLNGRDPREPQAHRAAMIEDSRLAPHKTGKKNAAAGHRALLVDDGQLPLVAAPRESEDGGVASEGERTAGVPDKSPFAPGDEEEDIVASPSSAGDHEVVLQALFTKADAVRYAIEVLDSTHTPKIVKWLKEHGRDVNRGQAHKITKAEAAERQKSRTRMVTTATPPPPR